MTPDNGSPGGDTPAADRHARHRRSNALQATAYAMLLDVDPRATATVLSALEQAGVAAYVEPTPGLRGGYLEVRLPDRPTDRLWTDPAQVTLARRVVGDVLAHLAEQPDEETAWQQIVAAFERPAPSPVPPWPVQEDRPTADDQPATGPADPPLRSVLLGAGLASPAHPVDEDEHYVPPPPPPVPRPHRHTAVAALAIIAGVLLVAWPDVVGVVGSPTVVVLGVLAIIGGAAALVWRMRDAPPTDSGPDDGAVV